jgi:hypothetical protein
MGDNKIPVRRISFPNILLPEYEPHTVECVYVYEWRSFFMTFFKCEDITQGFSSFFAISYRLVIRYVMTIYGTNSVNGGDYYIRLSAGSQAITFSG